MRNALIVRVCLTSLRKHYQVRSIATAFEPTTMDHKKRKTCDTDILLGREATNPLVMKLYDLIDKINLAAKRHEGNIPDQFQNTMDSHLDKIIRSCEEWLNLPKMAAREYLHQLHMKEPNYDDVKRVIAAFPGALICKNEHGMIPIQRAYRRLDGIKYVPLLATEAYLRSIGPTRGGLLLSYPKNTNCNILQSLAGRFDSLRPDWCDEICLKALQDLRSAGLLLDKDFAQYNLIGTASHNTSLKRLDYFLELYPEALSIPQPNNQDLPIHISNFSNESNLNVFRKLLTAGMEHYPEKLGFLFQPNAKDEIPITQAIDEYGKDETLQVIQDVIPSTQDCPILHYVFQYTPELCEDFIHRYPDAVSFKDGHGRNLLHVAMRNSMKLPDSVLTAIYNKECLGEKDPGTNLYPFMLAAASGRGNDNDLTSVYKLLTFCPDVISWCSSDDDDGMF